MEVSYKKLWKLLIDRDLKKQDLQKMASISAATIAKLGRNENVTTAILTKICSALNCNIGEIMDISEVDTSSILTSSQEAFPDGN